MVHILKNRLKEQRGLTLVELLAVIVILGIIAAIAVPSIMGIINKSKEDAVRADAIQVLEAAKLYVASEGTSTSLIDWDDLESYIDIDLITGPDSIDDADDNRININVNVSEDAITLSGYINRDGKSLEMTEADLDNIQDAVFDDTGFATATTEGEEEEEE